MSGSDTNGTKSTSQHPWGATEKRLGHLMVVELSRRVVQHRVIIKTFIGEREMLYPFHGEEQQENT
jgi:hypothetical protein